MVKKTDSQLPTKKKKRKVIYDELVLPSDDAKMQEFLKNNELMVFLHILTKIENAIESLSPLARIFRFEGSRYVMALKEDMFRENINNIYNYMIKNELYEHCGRVKSVEARLDAIIDKVHTKYI